MRNGILLMAEGIFFEDLLFQLKPPLIPHQQMQRQPFGRPLKAVYTIWEHASMCP